MRIKLIHQGNLRRWVTWEGVVDRVENVQRQRRKRVAAGKQAGTKLAQIDSR
ncbi:hypothetical protein [Nodosilinea sp. LEGE 06152]|uniref:hypothetical protein n=1 Tax=Nodosilinea sp. LEGE 06152 TaxID=2777966 RepID=UPI001882EF87|nr:hypothetical protein [Nodosilinea sp. LEGE 06152]